MARKAEVIEVADRPVTISNPDKIFFRQAGYTKRDLVMYYLAVADGALRGAGGRPMALKRFVDGADGEPFFQKRAPESRPDWIETVELSFPSGRTADEVVLRDAAQLAWVINLGCVDLNPHPVRAEDLDHPDELRIDLDPVPGVAWDRIVEVALVAKGVLEDHGLARVPRVRPDPAAVAVPAGAPGGRDGRAGGREPGAGPRHQQVVEGGAARRLRRLQPERQGPHGRLG